MKGRLAGSCVALALLAVLAARGHALPQNAGPASAGSLPSSAGGQAGVERLVSRSEVGRPGGQLVVILRAEPRTLNPVLAIDSPSKDVVWRTMADLIHINAETQRTEPALARSWTVSRDGRRFTLALRRGVRFSDGDAFDADDVLFSFQVYLDENVASPQRDLLIVGGQPITLRKIDQHTVQVDLAEAYATAERLFHGIAMLPRHLLEKPYHEGRLATTWTLGTPAQAFAGLGPFRLKEHRPGQRLELERNPFYWKSDRAGNQLPYLDRIVFTFVPSEDAQAVRFQSGEANVTTRLSAANFAVLMRDQGTRNYELLDAGPGLDYTFLFFNQNNLTEKGPAAVARKQAWFRQLPFRQAVSLAIDREGIVRLVYRGRATPLWGHVPPGNKLWVNRSLPMPGRSVARARQLLRQAGFTWKADGTLVDKEGQAVEFTVVTNTGNTERIQIATIIQDDLKQLGMRVNVVTLELRALLDRLLTTRDYEACVLGLGGGDGDPYSEMNVWLSSGGTHLWNPAQSQPATTWEAEIDTLMRRQLTTRDVPLRKRLYDRVQELVAQQLPIIALVSPNVLVGATKGLGNLRPAILDHHALWNVDELYWRGRPSGGAQ
jgi:peptide/nickel transport system substrate-binding protein